MKAKTQGKKLMSLEHVKSFYERLATDEDFRTRIQSVQNKSECSEIVQSAGYDFTQEELEDYTLQVLEANGTDSEFDDVDEDELSGVFGGLKYIDPPVQALYGIVIGDPLPPPIDDHYPNPIPHPRPRPRPRPHPYPDPQPLYGIIRNDDVI